MNTKYYKVIVLLRKMSVMRRRFTLPVQLIKTRFYKSSSYYPELPRKSDLRILGELMTHILRFGSIEWHYFSYGFDIKRLRNRCDYMDESDFMWQNNTLNMVQADMDYTCILRDKALFAGVLTSLGYNTPHTLAVISSTADVNFFIEEWRGEKSLFCKPVDGQCGHGAFKVLISTDGKYCVAGESYSYDDAKVALKHLLSSSPYIIQNLIEQSPEINSIYPNALNTLRITTFFDKKNKRAVPFASFFRTGARGGEVDNWAVGGILIGVDLFTGRLNKYGYYKQGYGGRTNRHPDSGFVFEDYHLPCYEQALHEAVSLHEQLNGIPVIGWDIAFTKEGLYFIEGNDNIEIGPIQIAADRGLKKEYLDIKQRCLGY